MSETESSTFHPCPDEEEIPFVMVPRALLRDSSLSIEARWFISYLLSHSGNWKVSIPYIIRTQDISKNRIYPLINECIKAGYVRREDYLDKGKKRFKYYVSKHSKLKKSLLCPQNQDTENQDPENEDTKLYQYSSKEELKKNKEREEAQPPTPPSFVQIKRVRIASDKYEQLVKDFGSDKVSEMIERLDEYADINPKRFKQYACHSTVIRKWIRDDVEKASKMPYNRLSNDQVSKDKGIAELIVSKAKGTKVEKDIVIGHDYIEFHRGMQTDVIKFGDKSFKEQCISALRKMNIIFHDL